MRLFLSVLMIAATSAAAAAQEVTVTGLDGTQWSGALTGLDAAAAHVDTGNEPADIPLNDIAEITWAGCNANAADVDGALFLLNGGGRLTGALTDGGSEQLTARTAESDQVVLRYADLAGVVLRSDENRAARKLFDEALADRLPGHDVLIALDDEPKALRGRLQSLGPEEGAFVFSGRARAFRTSKVYGVVFAKAAADQPAESARIELARGDRFTARKLQFADGVLRVTTTFGAAWTIPADELCTMRWDNPRVVYLDALPTERESTAGILHPTWPIVRNANVLHGPLRVGGKTYAHGIGVHARTELTWALGGAYAVFAAEIGIDDAVGAGGNAVFTVLGDGRQLYTSGPVSGREDARLVRLPVDDVDKLTLLVEPAANLDVGDWADWASARVILPKATP